MTAPESTVDPVEFDLTEFIKAGAVSLPKKSVDCLTDLDAGYRIAYEINPQIDSYEKQFLGTVGGVPENDSFLDGLRAEKAELMKRITGTRITFDLRGVAPALLKVLARKSKRETKKLELDSEDATIYHTMEVLREATQKVTWHATGREVTDKFSHEQIELLFDSLPSDQQDKLFRELDLICYGVVLNAEEIDAGFPGGATDES